MANEKRPPILVVDDDVDVRAMLQAILSRDEYDVTTAASFEDALRKLSVLTYEVAIVDLRLPGLDGIRLLREIQRRWPDTATIVFTGFPSLDSAVAALRAGAHDYLSKPCPPSEIRRGVQEALSKRRGLIKRLELMRELEQQLIEGLDALREDRQPPVAPPPSIKPSTVKKRRGGGRRSAAAPASSSPPAPAPAPAPAAPFPARRPIGQIIRAGPFLIDRERHEALLGDSALDLTPSEFEMLALLAERAPGVVGPMEILYHALNYPATSPREVRDLVRWHIHHLRRKIELDPDQPRMLMTVRGVGYKLNIT